MSENYSEMIEDTLTRLATEYPYEDWLKFDEFDAGDKLSQIDYITMKFKRHYMKEDALLERLKLMLRKETGDLYVKLMEGDRALKKTEIEKYYIPRDDRICEIEEAIVKQQTIVEYFKSAVRRLESVGWKMNAYMKQMGFGG